MHKKNINKYVESVAGVTASDEKSPEAELETFEEDSNNPYTKTPEYKAQKAMLQKIHKIFKAPKSSQVEKVKEFTQQVCLPEIIE